MLKSDMSFMNKIKSEYPDTWFNILDHFELVNNPTKDSLGVSHYPVSYKCKLCDDGKTFSGNLCGLFQKDDPDPFDAIKDRMFAHYYERHLKNEDKQNAKS